MTTETATAPGTELRAELAPSQFEEFYRNRRDQVYRGLALTLRDLDLAADATDEAMARAYQHWRSVKNYTNPEGWAYRVGLNWARSRMRKNKREVVGFRLDDRPGPETAPTDPGITEALAVLPVNQRAVVVLRFYYDWSTEQVAKSLGIPKGTVKSRLSRALVRLEQSPEVTV